jgi:hypothetical protein
MSPNFSSKTPSRGLAVLSLSATKAEWLEHDRDGLPLYACVDVEGEGVNDFVRAAIEARRRAGGKQRRCRLALAEGLFAHRLIPLPALGKRELRAVIDRKAHGALPSSDEDAPAPIFSALDVGANADGTRNWLIATLEREFTTTLLIRLRRARIRVRGVVSSTLAGLRRSNEFREADGKATLVIAVSHEAVEVSLVAEDRLVGSDTLDGNLRENPQLVTGLLQVARTSAAFWRKSQRGAEVAAVHVIGMPADRGQLLAQAVGTALPGTQVYCDPVSDETRPDAGRIALLASCTQSGPLALDVHVPLPPHRLVAAAGLVACAGSLLLGFGIVRHVVEEPRAQLLTEIAELEGEAADLAQLERRQTEVSESMRRIEQRMGRAVQIGRSAPDYSEVMADVLGALQGRASLLSIAVTSGEGGQHELRFKAVTTASPLHALRVAREVELALAALPQLTKVVLDLPTSFDAEEEAAGFPIDVRATLRGPR